MKADDRRGFHYGIGSFHVSLAYVRFGSNKVWELELGPFVILVHTLPAEWSTWSKEVLSEQLRSHRHWRVHRVVGFGFLGSSIYLNLWRLGYAVNVPNPIAFLFMLTLPLLKYLRGRRKG